MAKRLDPETLLRKHWRKALAIAGILFEEEGYHTRYLQEIEAFIGTTANVPACHGKDSDAPKALDEDTRRRAESLAECLHRAQRWCDDPQEPGRGTGEDLGHVYEEIKHLVARDPQAATALWAAYTPENGRGPEALDKHSAEPPSSEEHRYRIDHYPYSRFWAVYADEELVAVTVYRKGARSIVDRLEAQERTIATLRRQLAAFVTPRP